MSWTFIVCCAAVPPQCPLSCCLPLLFVVLSLRYCSICLVAEVGFVDLDLLQSPESWVWACHKFRPSPEPSPALQLGWACQACGSVGTLARFGSALGQT